MTGCVRALMAQHSGAAGSFTRALKRLKLLLAFHSARLKSNTPSRVDPIAFLSCKTKTTRRMLVATASRRKSAVEEDTDTLLSRARAHLSEINAKLAELDAARDAKLLATDGTGVDRVEAEQQRLRHDVERCNRRIELLEQRAKQELRARQVKANSDLIEREERKLKERDEHGADLAKHLAAAVGSFQKALAANTAVQAAWPFDVTDVRACLFGRPFVSAVAFELYRLSGQPYTTLEAERDFEFPGARCPSVTDPRPESVKPLVEQLREASAYASRQMRAAPLRSLPLPAPAITAPVVEPPKVATSEPQKKNDEPAATVNNAPNPEYVFRIDFIHHETREQRTEEVKFGQVEIDEAFLDGIGPTGPRGREIALRLASERVPPEFIFAGRPESLKFDLARLVESMNRD